MFVLVWLGCIISSLADEGVLVGLQWSSVRLGPTANRSKLVHSALRHLLDPEMMLQRARLGRTQPAHDGDYMYIELGEAAVRTSSCSDRKLVDRAARNEEGYVLWEERVAPSGTSRLRLAAATARGAVFGMGRALRLGKIASTLAIDGSVGKTYTLVPPLASGGGCVVHAPAPYQRVRGHQLSTWAFSLSPWPEAIEAHIRELAVFGTNMIEAAHIDLARGDLPKLADLADITQKLSLNFSIWYPLGARANDTDAILNAISHVESIFVPGGDGGPDMAPELLLQQCEGLGRQVQRTHPDAGIWVSAQEFSADNMTDFYRLLAERRQGSAIVGAVYGPHTRSPLLDFVDKVPDAFPVRQYPDIAHTIQAEFEVPDWDSAFAWTHGRQAVNPSPQRFHRIATLRQNSSYVSGPNERKLVGFGAYSEGANDDVNKVVWSAVAADSMPAESIVAEYSKYFFGADAGPTMARVLFALEDNWKGQLKTRVNRTLDVVAMIETVANGQSNNLTREWRFQMYAFRAYFDAHVAVRLAFEESSVATAIGAILSGSPDALAAAESALTQTAPESTKGQLQRLRSGVDTWARRLNNSVGGTFVQAQSPGLNLDTLDAAITDKIYLLNAIRAARKLPTAAEQLAAATRNVRRAAGLPEGSGGLVDVLGSADASARPRLAPGEGAWSDPAFYFTPLQATAPKLLSSAPRNWQTFSHPFFDASLEVRYEGLSSGVDYNVTIVRYGCPPPESGVCPTSGHVSRMVQLTANGFELHNFQPAPFPTKPVSFVVPAAVVAAGGGNITLKWIQEQGIRGNGQGGFICTVELARALV